MKIDNLPDILQSPIWCSSNLNQGQHTFIKHWYERGVKNISDLINMDGQLYTFGNFKETYNIRGTFLDYRFTLNKIPK